MMPSFDFSAPKFYDFTVKRSEKLLTSKLDPLNQNDRYFLNPKHSIVNEVLPKDLLKVQIQQKQDKQGKESPQNIPYSDRNNPKGFISTIKKNFDFQLVQEKPQVPKKYIQKASITLPKGVMSHMKAIIAPKTDAEIREKLANDKPPSVNRPIEVIKQENIELKPPSIKNESVPEKKPQDIILKKELEISSKSKFSNFEVEKNVQKNQPPVQNDFKTQNLNPQKHFFSLGVPEELSNAPEKSSNLPQQSNNPFIEKLAQKPANNPHQPINIFDFKAPEKPFNNQPQSTNSFVHKAHEKPFNNPPQSTNPFVHNHKAPEKPSNNPSQFTNPWLHKAAQKHQPFQLIASNNIYAQNAPEKPSSQASPQVNIFSQREQENKTKPKVQQIFPSKSKVFLGNIPANNDNINDLELKPKDPNPAVNRQQSINAIGNNGNVNPLARSNATGFNQPSNQIFSVQSSNKRTNLSLGIQIGNVTILTNNPGQLNRAISVASIPPNQNIVSKRPQPCLFPIRIQRQWEEAHGKKWYQLKSSEISAAEESMRKRLRGEKSINHPPKPKILNSTTNQNQHKNSFHNPNHTNTKSKPNFKF